MKERVPPKKHAWSWRSRAARGLVYQVLALLAVAGVVGFLAHNTQQNMQVRGIQSGFDFLGQAAGFDIGETMIAYDPSQSYGRALWIGVLNTLRVAVIGIVLTTVLGVLVGIGRFSRNALVRGLCYGYVELFRNVPILLQLLMWYLFFVEVLPPPQAAWNVADLFFLSKGGFALPVAGVGRRPRLGGRWVRWSASASAGGGGGARRPRSKPPGRTATAGPCRCWRCWAGRCSAGRPAVRPATGRCPSNWPSWSTAASAPRPSSWPCWWGWSMYTASFIAEVVRGGIQSVSHGQTEAASALGLSRRQQMRLVVLPQALRVIIPPLTNQYLNLTKNSSLAVAIGYPDVVSIANTTLNQTGRAVECIAIIMLVYLCTSLGTSALMNWYNKRVAIMER